VIVTLLYSISGGMLAVLGTARLLDIAWKFLRLVGLLTLAMGSLATALTIRNGNAYSSSEGSSWIVICGATLAGGATLLTLAAPITNRLTAILRATCLIAGGMGIAASVLYMNNQSAGNQGLATFGMITGQVLGAWLLGSITLAWLLGHAYLTATKMTIAPLRYFSRTLSMAVAVRVTFLVLAAALAWWMQDTSVPTVWTRLEQWWLIALLRVGVGLVAVAIMTYMVADCVRLRSTQSATGILYFASVMAYVGELASQYLTRELGWPL
jgi:hypothetical protein